MDGSGTSERNCTTHDVIYIGLKFKIPEMELLYSMPLWGSKQSH